MSDIKNTAQADAQNTDPTQSETSHKNSLQKGYYEAESNSAGAGGTETRQPETGLNQSGPVGTGESPTGQSQINESPIDQSPIDAAQSGQPPIGQTQSSQTQNGQAQTGPAQVGQASPASAECANPLRADVTSADAGWQKLEHPNASQPEGGWSSASPSGCGSYAGIPAGGGAGNPSSGGQGVQGAQGTQGTLGAQGQFMCPLWMELKKPWRKRHPVKFWLGILLLVFVVFPGIIVSVGGDVSNKDKVAIVNIEGIILDGKQVIDWVNTVQADPLVKGVLVRVNSPGGAVTPSQEIYFAIKRLAAHKPVVVSMGALAASGGYYVSLPANQIFAVPSTVTGSIGVKMGLTNVESLMEKLGVESTSLASGTLKDAGSPFKPLRDDERQYFLGVIMDMYDDFLTTVIEHRKITLEQLEAFSDGRALTGRQAKELGLVDRLGDKNDALLYLYDLCGVTAKESRLVEGPVKRQSFLERLTDGAVDSLLSKSAETMSTAGTPVFMYR